MERVKSVLDTLCSKEMLGRGYVNNGHIKASDYLVETFKTIGLKKVKGKYTQEFPMSINTFPGEVLLSQGKRDFEVGKDFIVHPACPSVDLRFQAYLIDSSFYRLRNYYLFIKNGRNKGLNPVVSDQVKVKDVDSLIASNEVKVYLKEKLTASYSRQQDSTCSVYLLKDRYNPDELWMNLKVDAKFERNVKANNVMGLVKGNNHDSMIVVTGHYDHLGAMGKAYFPGANDNASGISMIIELAHYYAKHRPKYDMLFIAFGGEEAGLLGSRYFVDNSPVNLNKIKCVINLDLVGTGDDGITVVNGAVYKDDFNKMKKISEENDFFDRVNPRGRAANSDHYFFSKKGIKSFFIYTLGGTTAYHDIYDRADSLPLTRYSQLFQLVRLYLDE